jgi:elongation factor Ts
MADITASMVKALREETSQGMMECKKALTECNGDVDAAKDLLRQKGLVKAEKKAERETAEGLVRIRINGDNTIATIVEIKCETDFCARNDEFQAMADKVTDLAVEAPVGPILASDAMTELVQGCFAKIGENMSYGQGVKLTGVKVGHYLHHDNKTGVIVAVDKDADEDLLRKVCQHIAFSDPLGITEADLPADLVEKEAAFAKQEAIDSGKNEEIAEKMVVGKMRKFVAQHALMEQAFVHDDKKSVREILDGATVTGFARFKL